MAELVDTEAASVERVAQILKLMKPPLTVPKDAERGPRMFELSVAGLPGESDTRYLVQLPPEYDPLRQYPTIVTLADVTASPEQMLDFWAGPFEQEKAGERLGQATRHGYITIAVDWRQPHQSSYDYSAREHHAVLGALRDACRRFAIDTDRVFLDWPRNRRRCGVGHRFGPPGYLGRRRSRSWRWPTGIADVTRRTRITCRGTSWPASWMATSSPATPASSIATSRSTPTSRWWNTWAGGSNRLAMRYSGCSIGWVGGVAIYRRKWNACRCGRGTISSGGSKSRVYRSGRWFFPAIGHRTALPARTNISGKRLETNKIAVKVQAEKVIVWLSPELVDFNERLVVEVNNRAISPRDRIVRPDLNVLLEDARTRGDRQHPFWAKLETP